MVNIKKELKNRSVKEEEIEDAETEIDLFGQRLEERVKKQTKCGIWNLHKLAIN